MPHKTIEEIRREIAGKSFERSMYIDRETMVDEANRTVNLAFASDKPCETWFGELITTVSKKAIRSERLEAGLAVLLDHDRTKQVGIVESFSLDNDGVARALVRFSRSMCGEEIFQDVKDAVRRSVSVGFFIHEMHLEKQEDGEPDLYRSDDWEPIEISIVSIPADISVGVGRSLEDKTNRHSIPIQIDVSVTPSPSERAISNNEEKTMTPEEIAAAKKAADEKLAAEKAVKREEIIAFAEIFKEGELAREMLLASDDVTLDDVRTAIRAKQTDSTKVPPPPADQKAATEKGRQEPAQVRNRAFKTLGETLIESDVYKNAEKGRQKKVNISVESNVHTRATFSGSGTGLTDYDRQPGMVLLDLQRLTVADLLAQGQTNSPVVRYMQEVSYTNAATTVAEGAAKPEATFDLIEVDAAVRKVAVRARITDETLEDFAEVRSYIDNRLMFMVQQEEEDQLLNGDGVSPNLAGILDFTIQTQPIGADPMQEAIYKAITKVRSVGFVEPDALVIHPTDYQNLRLVREGVGTGQYLGGGFFTGAFGTPFIENPPIWGLRTVVTTAIAAGDPLVGAFKFGAQVFYRNGLTIEATNSNADDFEKNLISLRAEQRLGLAVYRPLAFCQVLTP